MYYFWMLESFFSLLHFWLHDLINYGQKGGFLLPSGYEYDSTYTGLLQIQKRRIYTNADVQLPLHSQHVWLLSNFSRPKFLFCFDRAICFVFAVLQVSKLVVRFAFNCYFCRQVALLLSLLSIAIIIAFSMNIAVLDLKVNFSLVSLYSAAYSGPIQMSAYLMTREMCLVNFGTQRLGVRN